MDATLDNDYVFDSFGDNLLDIFGIAEHPNAPKGSVFYLGEIALQGIGTLVTELSQNFVLNARHSLLSLSGLRFPAAWRI
jgi:hypothetical protein